MTVNPNSLSRTPYNKNKTNSMLLICRYIREYQQRDAGFDYGSSIHSAILYFLEAGIANEMKAPTFRQCYAGIRKILNSEICKWYIRQEKPAVAGWYGQVQKNISRYGTIGLLYRSKCKKLLHKLRHSV